MVYGPRRPNDAAKRIRIRDHGGYDRYLWDLDGAGKQEGQVKWVLVMVVFNGSFFVEIDSEHETMAECYFASTQIHWEERMPINKELVCIQIEETE